MQLQEITNKEEWNSFLAKIQPNTFLHSWEWKEIQEADPACAKASAGAAVNSCCKTWGFYEHDELIGVALVITVNAKRGNHYLIPHGPILKDQKYLDEVLTLLKAQYSSGQGHESSVCLRVAPLIENTSNAIAIFNSLGFRSSPMHVHAELTWVLDISKPEEGLLKEMRKTTRNAIVKAQKEGVSVEISSDPLALERFWPLYEQTKDRHGFIPFHKSFIQSQAEIFGKENKMFFAIAKYQGQDVAAAMLIHSGSTVFYYHGASTKVSVPAAQLLQWEAIKEAKKRSATRYNFWGIAPIRQAQSKPDPNHPFAGITIFKTGFGGYAIDYMHAQDLPLSWKYWKLWAIEMWRKKKRGF